MIEVKGRPIDIDDDDFNNEFFIDNNNKKMKVQFYFCNKEMTLEEANEQLYLRLFGNIEMDYTDTVFWSECTIEPFCVKKLSVGGHDIMEIVNSANCEYLIIVFELVDDML